MKLDEFKKQYIRSEILITEDYGRIFTFIDFGNVNYWFSKDRQDSDNKLIDNDYFLKIDLEKLNDFLVLFSNDVRFYYGTDPQKDGSVGFISSAKNIFGRNRVFSKTIQYIHHNLTKDEMTTNTRATFVDKEGYFVKIPKCNFDVEIAVDSIRKLDEYDTLVMFSGDADFLALFRYLKKKGKKIILVKGGHITSDLRESANLVVNAQKIKKYITKIEKYKQKPGI